MVTRSAAVRSPEVAVEPSSFRDPSGFVYRRDGILYRQVNRCFKEDFDRFVDSGLCRKLQQAGLLIAHEEVSIDLSHTDKAYKVIQPERLPYVSYPYEWSFSQLKDAALTTIRIQKAALDCGMSLKDCSAYNVQFLRGKPIFIDTLSFETYLEGQPWVAYRQFCQHFLAPLALMSYVDVRLSQLLRVYIDGLPLDLTSPLLPLKTRLKLGLLSHIHLHARAQTRYASKTLETRKPSVSRVAMLGLIDNLERSVQKFRWEPQGTEWAEYYNFTNYSDSSTEQKRTVVGEFLDEAKPRCVWDIGANTGLYSRVSSDRGIGTIAYDIDPAAVEKNYRMVSEKQEEHILPLLLDLGNPSPGIGWGNTERESFFQRGPVDLVMALALIHHVAISNNVALARTAEQFARIADFLIIEFVPKSDSQVKILLSTREDIFPDYRRDAFEEEYAQFFDIVRSVELEGTERTLYLMRKKAANRVP